jgi:L-fuculose-phosphate aldolase
MNGFPDREAARQEIIEVGRRLYERGLVCAAEGNISVRTGENEVLATASGVHKGTLAPDRVVPVTMRGEPLAPSGPRVSTEIDMHLAAYAARPDVRAVVHAHPPTATAFAVAGIPLAQCVMPEVVVTLGGVPIAPYGTPGTRQVADGLRDLYPRGNAFLLANHGAVTLGRTLPGAFDLMETLEHFAEILWKARALGNVNVLTEEHVRQLLEHRRAAGIQDAVFPCDVCSHCPTPPTAALGSRTDDARIVEAVAATIRDALSQGT